MKRIIAVILLLLVYFFGNTQQYQKDPLYGKTVNRTTVLYNLGIPGDTIPPPVSQQMYHHLAMKGNAAYFWSPITLKYEVWPGGGGGGSYFAGLGLDLNTSTFDADTTFLSSVTRVTGMPAWGISNANITTWNSKISLTNLSASSPLGYNNATGVFTVDTTSAPFGLATKGRLYKALDSLKALTVTTELDPVYTASPAFTIDAGEITAWNALIGHTHNGLAPTGGSAGQVLTKIDGTNYNYSWQAPPANSQWNGLFQGTSLNAGSTTMSTGIQGYSFNGASPSTFTLPALVANRAFFIKNRGTATLTILRAGSDVMYDVGDANSIDLAPGEWAMVWADANRWNVHKPGAGGGGGSGTVTSVSEGWGTDFATINISGSVIVDSTVVASRALVTGMPAWLISATNITNWNTTTSATQGYMAVGNSSNILQATSDIQWDDANNIMNIGGSASEGLNSLIGMRVQKGITLGNRIHFNNTQYDAAIIADDGFGSSQFTSPRAIAFTATGSLIFNTAAGNKGFDVDVNGNIRFGNYSTPSMYWGETTKSLSIAGAGGGVSSFSISKPNVTVDNFIDMVNGTGGTIRIGGLSSSGFLPAITFTPDGTVQNSAYFLTITQNTGTAAFVVDSRLVGGPLTTQDLFAVQTYGNEKLKVQADGDVWLNSVANDNALTDILVYDATNKVVRTRTVASLPGGGTTYTFTASDFDEAGTTISLDATLKANWNAAYDDIFKSNYFINTIETGYDSLFKYPNDSTVKSIAIRHLAGSSKISVVRTTPFTDATLWTYDINEANLSLQNIGGALAAGNVAGTQTNGYVVKLVAGVPTWSVDATGGGGSTPDGGDFDIQYNGDGFFEGSSNFQWNRLQNKLKLTGTIMMSNGTDSITLSTAGHKFKMTNSIATNGAMFEMFTFNDDAYLGNAIAGAFMFQTNQDTKVRINADGSQWWKVLPTYSSGGYDVVVRNQTNGNIEATTISGGSTAWADVSGKPNSGSFIYNQFSSSQTTASFWIDGAARVNGDIESPTSINIHADNTYGAEIANLYNDGGTTGRLELNDSGTETVDISGAGYVNASDYVSADKIQARQELTVYNGANAAAVTYGGGSSISLTLPTSAGQLALVSQIPTNNNTLTNGSGYLTTYNVGYNIKSPTASEQLELYKADGDGATATATNSYVVVRGTSPSITYAIHYGTTYGSSSGTVVASNTVTTSGNITINTAAIPANAYVWLVTTATSGTVDEFSVNLKISQ